jgi:hypothetical protein
LHLDDQETRSLLKASLTALAPYWLVPLSRRCKRTGVALIARARSASGAGFDS